MNSTQLIKTRVTWDVHQLSKARSIAIWGCSAFFSSDPALSSSIFDGEKGGSLAGLPTNSHVVNFRAECKMTILAFQVKSF